MLRVAASPASRLFDGSISSGRESLAWSIRVVWRAHAIARSLTRQLDSAAVGLACAVITSKRRRSVAVKMLREHSVCWKECSPLVRSAALSRCCSADCLFRLTGSLEHVVCEHACDGCFGAALHAGHICLHAQTDESRDKQSRRQ